jgi:ubiquinone/menaquinone biosynthesis C-methylase UbiE
MRGCLAAARNDEERMRREIADKLMIKVADDYDVIADAFSSTRVAAWPEMARVREFVKPGNRVLDIGCGNGRAYQLFSGMAIEYEGIDASDALIAHAKKNVSDLLASFRVGSMTALPFAGASFDAVIAIASLHHVPSREYRRTALREMHRVLKPGGTLFMTNWDRWKPKYAREHLVAALKKIFGLSPYDFGDIFVRWNRHGENVMRYYHAFTRRGLAASCRDAGFTVVENYHVAKGERVPWWKGDNIVTICRKPATETAEMPKG